MHTTHTSRSQSRGKSHVSHAKSERGMQREIDELLQKSLELDEERRENVMVQLAYYQHELK